MVKIDRTKLESKDHPAFHSLLLPKSSSKIFHDLIWLNGTQPKVTSTWRNSSASDVIYPTQLHSAFALPAIHTANFHIFCQSLFSKNQEVLFAGETENYCRCVILYLQPSVCICLTAKRDAWQNFRKPRFIKISDVKFVQNYTQQNLTSGRDN